jgi:glyoxylase-like metal-dependent hydrolase (beta-lactamase superfamily II)
MIIKELVLSVVIVCLLQFTLLAQEETPKIGVKEVFRNKDVVFNQIDEHTWVGTGHLVFNESIYLIEGNDKAILIDVGTKIKNLDKIVASITKKPIMLVATHVHGDHTGLAVKYFPEIYINPADTFLIPGSMRNYKGKVKYLKDAEIIDLGGRKLEVIFTPAHTPGSTTFIDKEAGYGFSGDSFGSGNLLLTSTFSELIATCMKMSEIMEKSGIKILYPGHYFGNNAETKKRVDDMIILSKDVLSGKVKGDVDPKKRNGLNIVVSDYGVRINYNEKAIK